MITRKTLAVLITISLFCTFLLQGAAAPSRIVAVGDVHGDLDDLVSILGDASLIDSNRNWTGGSSVLIQLGDILDRGQHSRDVMEFLMKLQVSAEPVGGRVVSMLGNHEMMNLIGDLRYVPAEEFGRYEDQNSKKRREKAYKDFQKFWEHRAEVLHRGKPVFTKEMKENWETDHPLGFIEQREAFSPDGKYGAWIRTLPPIVELNGIVFVHGGISPMVQAMGVSGITEKVRQEIRLFDDCKKFMIDERVILSFFTLPEMLEMARQELEIRKTKGMEGKDIQPLEDFLGLDSWITVNPEGPLWFRGFSKWTDEEMARFLPPILSAFGNRHFVVGHTVQENGIMRARSEGQIILIDTGMLNTYYPGGRASALEIKNEVFTAIYPGERMVISRPE